MDVALTQRTAEMAFAAVVGIGAAAQAPPVMVGAEMTLTRATSN